VFDYDFYLTVITVDQVYQFGTCICHFKLSICAFEFYQCYDIYMYSWLTKVYLTSTQTLVFGVDPN